MNKIVAMELEFLDLGGGFKVPYNVRDPETDMPLLGQKVNEAVNMYELQRITGLFIEIKSNTYCRHSKECCTKNCYNTH